MKKKIMVSIVFLIISIFLAVAMSIQFRTINQTDITALESMQDEELRSQILELKEQNEELSVKIADNKTKINEYNETLNNNQKAADLLQEELNEYERLIGLTDVNGEGIILTLTDTDIQSYSYRNLVDFVNELKYAGATAISINDYRVINTTEIVEISKKYILLNGDQRISSPYVIKAIGDKEKLYKTLTLKDEGYVDLYRNSEYQISIEQSDNISINKYDKELKDLEYIKEGE